MKEVVWSACERVETKQWHRLRFSVPSRDKQKILVLSVHTWSQARHHSSWSNIFYSKILESVKYIFIFNEILKKNKNKNKNWAMMDEVVGESNDVKIVMQVVMPHLILKLYNIIYNEANATWCRLNWSLLFHFCFQNP